MFTSVMTSSAIAAKITNLACFFKIEISTNHAASRHSINCERCMDVLGSVQGKDEGGCAPYFFSGTVLGLDSVVREFSMDDASRR